MMISQATVVPSSQPHFTARNQIKQHVAKVQRVLCQSQHLFKEQIIKVSNLNQKNGDACYWLIQADKYDFTDESQIVIDMKNVDYLQVNLFKGNEIKTAEHLRSISQFQKIYQSIQDKYILLATPLANQSYSYFEASIKVEGQVRKVSTEAGLRDFKEVMIVASVGLGVLLLIGLVLYFNKDFSSRRITQQIIEEIQMMPVNETINDFIQKKVQYQQVNQEEKYQQVFPMNNFSTETPFQQQEL
ncbi:UNKNOWN [Stylonychia lemnae]|uniref:Uncharacterized protein n=1 Tax=Stylonychia lemnae TaxID=5949 RepID=A0A078AHX9_STYLE|nr:UNKNOWN [Stylonychia lemnae]|eukprot:CDW81117.1 UNKNOWN [Stylonychia lemnae]